MISVVIPCYCSAKTVRAVVLDVKNALTQMGEEYQFVLVNDGSPDNTFAMIEELCREDKNITGIDFSKNYGQQAARLAAIPYIKGEYVVYMDDDGQHPASGIIALYEKIKEGYDVVYADFKEKKQGWFKKMASRINTATLSFLTGKPKDIKSSSFTIMKHYVLKEMAKYKSPFPSWTGFVMQITRNVANAPLEHGKRLEGKSGYTLGKMIKLYFNSLTGFSIVPLRIASILGILTASSGFLYGLFLVIRRLANPNIPVGYTSIIAILLFLAGIIMLILGLVGEYIGRIYMTISGMPQYTVKNVVNAEIKDR